LAIPGNVGGTNWSGYAFDPQRSLLIVNTNNLPAKVKLIPSAQFDNHENRTEPGEYSPQTGAPYGMFRRPFMTASHLPCSAPPWGTLAAVDMIRGTIRWQVPLGSFQDFAPGHPAVPAGSLSLGGSIVTAGGLVFIAGTLDPYIRAFDVETGKELWKVQLPASGHATPMTYQLKQGGKQYLVIAAGGHAKIDEEPQSDSLLAFTLP
jgi:quinoprotein glucose dehydrogenase